MNPTMKRLANEVIARKRHLHVEDSFDSTPEVSSDSAEQHRSVLSSHLESFRIEPGLGTHGFMNESNRTAQRRLLFISYSFPPVGGAGVQRAAKFVKYLPQFGWECVVLTVDNPSVPVHDGSLVNDVPAECQVIRTRTWEPSYRAKERVISRGASRTRWWKAWAVAGAKSILQPDPQCLWTWPTRFRLRRIDAAGPFEAVVVSGPPFSTFELGRIISRRYHVPLLLDFRDEWLLSKQTLEHHQAGTMAKRWHARMFRRALRSADAITATTQASAEFLRQQSEALGLKPRIAAIYNGFDPDDFTPDTSRPPASSAPVRATAETSTDKKLVLAYHGTLWNLTDIHPLIAALNLVARDEPAVAKRIRLRIVGRVTEGQQQSIASLDSGTIELDQRPYVPHAESVRLAREADLLVLLLTDTKGAERVVPAKLFEYLALRRPILAITPPGEAADLLRRTSHAHVFKPEQVTAITDWIYKFYEAESSCRERASSSIESIDLNWCTRPNLTRQLASLLDELVSDRRDGTLTNEGSRERPGDTISNAP